MVHPVRPSNGNYLTFEDVLANVTYDDGDIHAAPTKVISLENTLHGIIIPIEEIRKISEFCRENDIRLHLDGARLWNASVATGISIKNTVHILTVFHCVYPSHWEHQLVQYWLEMKNSFVKLTISKTKWWRNKAGRYNVCYGHTCY